MELVGIDVSANMLVSAARRARDLGLEVDLRVDDAQALDLAAQRACAEAWRVLKTGGQFLVLDHVRSRIAAARWMQGLLDVPASRLMHVHLLRDPLDYLGAVGLRIEHCERSKSGLVEQAVATKEA